MDDKELDNYMKTVNPNFDSHIEKGTIEMSNEYYNLLEEKMARLINKNQSLKKQLEELDKKLFFTKNELDMREKSINNQLNQQKEFIKWLEDYLNLFDYNDIEEQAGYDMLEEILQKYKNITGVSDENTKD